MRRSFFRWILLLLSLGGGIAGCGRDQAPTSSEVVAVKVATIPRDGADPVWRRAPVCRVPLVLQDMVEPRLLKPSTPAVSVQAATDGVRLAFRVAWIDSTRDDLPGPAGFVDACALQLPALASADLPAPQMGEPGRGVQVTYWSSSWQAAVDGRKPDIHSIYPNAAVDHYPFEAASISGAAQAEMATRYAPAMALGNFMAGDGKRAVQDLVAEGPGTLTAAQAASSDGKGGWTGAGWEVVISRPLPGDLEPAGRTQVAFAVWQGSRQEVGARKMRSVWTPLSLGGPR